MSFGGASGGDGLPQFKKFVSQGEIDEAKKKRQDEWEKVRKPEDPEEAPEEKYDHRSLYDRLQEQKDKKQEDHDSQFKLSNQVRGIDEDEAKFLDFVSNKQEELEQKRELEDSVVLSEYHNALVVNKVVDSKQSEKKPAKQVIPQAKNKKSQLALLAGAVKRKSTSTDSTNTEPDSKKIKNSSDTTPSENSVGKDNSKGRKNNTAKVIGILPGLGHYSDSSDSDSSSDSDCNTDLFKRKIIVHC